MKSVIITLSFEFDGIENRFLIKQFIFIEGIVDRNEDRAQRGEQMLKDKKKRQENIEFS